MADVGRLDEIKLRLALMPAGPIASDLAWLLAENERLQAKIEQLTRRERECGHHRSTSFDGKPVGKPGKVYQCDACGFRFVNEFNEKGFVTGRILAVDAAGVSSEVDTK